VLKTAAGTADNAAVIVVNAETADGGSVLLPRKGIRAAFRHAQLALNEPEAANPPVSRDASGGNEQSERYQRSNNDAVHHNPIIDYRE
jgi:hypothetical protein